MFIKEVILDGFKSYATRTVVSGFDPKFNAITGLNGSGKSNILDSICFVLGITQLSQVRVSNLQGLVYKQGQAGVTKASVTIVFDNSDSKSSPVGYEQYDEITITRQVVIGGRNKYLINGRTAQATQVQNLFHSVQLNVNNPHFLIMQGRITKVLNMKPPEILGMVEEAAGTRMYEAKKVAAEKKMDQKQVKVDEIEKLLSEEITPKLDKLRNEKQTYLKWAANNTELERAERFCIAYEYLSKSSLLEASQGELEGLRAQVESYTNERDELRNEQHVLLKKQTHLKQTKRMKLESSLEALNKQEEKLSKDLVKFGSQFQNVKEAHEKEKERVESMKAKELQSGKSLEALQEKVAEAEATRIESLKSLRVAETSYENAQKGLQAANAGMQDDGNGENTSLTEKLSQSRCAAEAAGASMKQTEMKIKHAKKESKTLDKELKSAAKADKKMTQSLKTKQKAVEALEAEINDIGFCEETLDKVISDRESAEEEFTSLQENADTLWAKLSAFHFDFDSPSKNFDRSKVKGLVAQLVKMKQQNTATALEVVAGGKLYQVVVDSAETGKSLLKKGNLKRRVTIIPLDKVSAREIPQENLQNATHIAQKQGGTANVALSLVGYDEEVQKAMQYVFGTTLVCDSLETARAVTFSKSVRVKSVTLDGDSFDPQGTLSGGSKSARGSVLLQLEKLSVIKNKMDTLESTIASCTQSINTLLQGRKKSKELNQKLEVARHELSIIEARANETEYVQIQKQKELVDLSIIEMEKSLETLKLDQMRLFEEAKEIELEMQDMDAAREKIVKKAQQNLQVAKTELQKTQKLANQAEEAEDNAKLEIEQLLSERESLVQEIIAATQALASNQEEVLSLEEKYTTQTQEYKVANSTLETKKEELKDCEQEISGISNEISNIEKRIQKCEIESQKIQGRLSRFNNDQKEAERTVTQMLEQYPWIESEKQFFGQPHTDYDFESRDIKSAQHRLKKLQDAQQKLSQKINKKVMGMIEKAEQEYNDLNRKRAIIEKDRQTIKRVIIGLDKKKNEALQSTYEKVNKDFGSIFSTLLQGAKAKLDPPEGGTVLDGLEVKVGFGNTWKESLTELSGGQRSLLALSLILSLLLFKPAPMYILDEVDAALDLSHTQNIGQMLRTHFSQSQFIVVSLKEGMFNNANVIFRTKFVDGVSTVRRTIGNSATVTGKENIDSKSANEKKSKRQKQISGSGRNARAIKL